MSSSKKVMLSAIQGTHHVTLGNYLGAIKNWVATQEEHDNIFFLVDLHSITARQDPATLRDRSYRALATFLAAGLDPAKCTLFVQSHVPEHAELNWVLTCFSYMGELSRMTQFKDKSAKHGQTIPAGLFCYPVLMAADILLYRTDLVPVGEDQKQHVELTRDLAIRMNGIYGADLFKVPEPVIPKVGARIMSLQDATSKMSKSDENESATIFLSDSNDAIMKKLKRAVTDSGTEIRYVDEQAGVKNLISIQAALTGQSPEKIVESYAGKQYGHLKIGTAEVVIAAVEPMRKRVEELMNDIPYLNSVLAEGAAKARARAKPMLADVYRRVGFIPR